MSPKAPTRAMSVVSNERNVQYKTDSELDLDLGDVDAGDGIDMDMEMDLGLEIDMSTVHDPADAPDGVSLIEEEEPPAPPVLDENDSFDKQEKVAISETLKKMRQRATDAHRRFDANVSGDYYFCVVFLSQVQKRAFLEQTVFGKFAYNSVRFLNGVALAKHLGVELPESPYNPREPKK